MQKQFQKLGLFVSRNCNEEPKVADKKIKCLYKKDVESVEKPRRRKKSESRKDTLTADSPRPPRKISEEGRHQARKSKESLQQKHIKHKSPVKELGSENPLLLFQQEDIKKLRRSGRSTRENASLKDAVPNKKQKDGNSSREKHHEKKRHQKKEDVIIDCRTNTDDCAWLTRKDIAKLLKTTKESPKTESANTNFFKKFFVFEKQGNFENVPSVVPTKIHRSKKLSHHHSDKNVLAAPVKKSVDSPRKKNEKRSRLPEKRSKDDADVSDPRKQPDKTKPRDHKVKNQQAPIDLKPERKKQKRLVDQLVFEELKFTSKESETVKTSSKKEKKRRKEPTNLLSGTELRPRSRSRDKSKDQAEGTRGQSKPICNVNPVRHLKCLVRSTFPLVEINPRVMPDFLEKKKKLKTFKKYYKYSVDTEDSVSTAYCNLSDSHRLYEDMSDDDVAEEQPALTKIIKSNKNSNLTEETNVSNIFIQPDYVAPNQATVKWNEDEENTKKTKKQKSRIPVLTNFNNYNNKIVELAQDRKTTSNSYRKSAEFFTPSFLKEKGTTKAQLRDDRTQKLSREKEVKNVAKNIVAAPTTAKKSTVNKPVAPSSAKTQKLKSPRPQSLPDKTKNVLSRDKKQNTLQRKDSKVSTVSTASKQSKMSNPAKKIVSQRPSSNVSKNDTLSQSSQPPKKFKSPSRISNDGTSSVWSKGSKKTNKSSLASKSGSKCSGAPMVKHQNNKTSEKSSPKGSISDSTCGEKSVGSSRNNSTFLVTKSFKDEEKISRWQKRKMYADHLRQKVVKKGQKSTLPSQVVEIRYLTVSNDDNIDGCAAENKIEENLLKSPHESAPSVLGSAEFEISHEEGKEFYDDDLPESHLKMIDNEKFKELFELPEKTLNEVLNENYNFLQKDFSFINEIKCCSSPDSFSSEEVISFQKSNDWYNFHMSASQSLTDISCCRKSSTLPCEQNLSLTSQDQIVDSLSAPGSEESGYETMNSTTASRSFFEKSNIKDLLKPHFEPLDTYYVDLRSDNKSSSTCALDITSNESKSLQTTIESSQKSIQIKSQEEKILDIVEYCRRNGVKSEKQETLMGPSVLGCNRATRKEICCGESIKIGDYIQESCENPQSKEKAEEVIILSNMEENRRDNTLQNRNFFDQTVGTSEESPEQCRSCDLAGKNEPLKIKRKKRKSKRLLSFLFCIRRVPSDEYSVV